jgi:hypothetical protein
MVKVDYDRDYYKELELAPTADDAEIKSQFRKLGASPIHHMNSPGSRNRSNLLRVQR